MSDESERIALLVDQLSTEQRRDILERVAFEVQTAHPTPGADWPSVVESHYTSAATDWP